MLSSGANTALLVPMTILASPFSIRLYSSVLWPSERLLCITATLLPKRSVKFLTIWGVSDISGTSIRAVFPCFNALSISFKKTVVLPLPVTPLSKAHCGLPLSISSDIPLYTADCSSDSTISSMLLTAFAPAVSERETSLSKHSTMPFFSILFITADVTTQL